MDCRNVMLAGPGLLRRSALLCLAVLLPVTATACFEDSDTPEEDEWCDSATLLCWQNPPSTARMDWEHAAAWCDGLTWNGHTNWQLPTVFELRTLVERCATTVTDGTCPPGGIGEECLSSDCNNGCQGCAAGGGPDAGSDGCYWPVALSGTCGTHWTSSLLPDVGGAGWYVDFVTAAIGDAALESTYAVRCVRPMPWEEDTGRDAVEDTVEQDVPDITDKDVITGDTTTIKDTEAPDMVVTETIDPYDCDYGDTKCVGDEFWKCNNSSEWVLEYDCFESWQLCGETTYGGFGCVEYPDCTADQVGERRCWRDRALKCVTADIDWQLSDDCADYADMFCEADDGDFLGKCLHNGGLSWIDPDTGIEWQRTVFPDHDANFVNWLDANDYCEDLVWGDPPHDDWHLPTISNLRTLVRGCAGTMTGGNCAYTDACMEDCWEGDCWGCEQWKGPTISVYDEDKGAYIVPEFEYEFTQMSWSMYIWSGTHCEYYTDRPEAQFCRIDFRNGAVEVKYNDADLGYAVCVRAPD